MFIFTDEAVKRAANRLIINLAYSLVFIYIYVNKGYLVTSGYDSKVLDKEFSKLATISRKKVLDKQRNSKKRKKDNVRNYRFVTAYEPAFPDKEFMAYEPAFPDIKKVLLSHQNIIYENEELREVFPNGARDFQVSERKEAKKHQRTLSDIDNFYSRE